MNIESGKCIIEFSATWCGPCNMFKPIFEKVSKNFSNIKFFSIDVDNDKYNLAKKFGVMSIPTVILLDNGKEVRKNVGFMSEDDFIKFINKR